MSMAKRKHARRRRRRQPSRRRQSEEEGIARRDTGAQVLIVRQEARSLMKVTYSVLIWSCPLYTSREPPELATYDVGIFFLLPCCPLSCSDTFDVSLYFYAYRAYLWAALGPLLCISGALLVIFVRSFYTAHLAFHTLNYRIVFSDGIE